MGFMYRYYVMSIAVDIDVNIANKMYIGGVQQGCTGTRFGRNPDFSEFRFWPELIKKA
jgi:hypothetical protein